MEIFFNLKVKIAERYFLILVGNIISLYNTQVIEMFKYNPNNSQSVIYAIFKHAGR